MDNRSWHEDLLTMSKEHKFSFNNKPQLLVCGLNSQHVYIVINQDLMSDDDNLLKDLSHIAYAYHKALWIVVLLNVGYILAEMIGGFLTDSQALKADALDFLGDGSITFLGLLVIGWDLKLRSCSTLIQKIFLGVMGV